MSSNLKAKTSWRKLYLKALNAWSQKLDFKEPQKAKDSGKQLKYQWGQGSPRGVNNRDKENLNRVYIYILSKLHRNTPCLLMWQWASYGLSESEGTGEKWWTDELGSVVCTQNMEVSTSPLHTDSIGCENIRRISNILKKKKINKKKKKEFLKG